MRSRPHLLIWTAWFLYGIAWLLPVIPDFPGWLAPFHVLFPLNFREGDNVVLTAASVVTNVLFLVCPLYYLSPLARSRRMFARVTAVAFLVNGHWYVQATDRVFPLVVVVLLLAVGFFDLAGPHEASGFSHS